MWEAAGSVLWLGRGWRNVLVLSKCLSPSGTWPEFPSPSHLSYLSNSWGLWAEVGPPSTWLILPGELAWIICCCFFSSSALGRDEKQVGNARRSSACLEGSRGAGAV